MPSTECGFINIPGGAPAADLLVSIGPTLFVDIGFDPNFQPPPHPNIPVAGITGIQALVDTGASESCIDSLLATQLGLPILDRRTVSGVSGPQEINMHLAQVHVPSLGFTIYGAFAGVHLARDVSLRPRARGLAFEQTSTARLLTWFNKPAWNRDGFRPDSRRIAPALG